MKRMLVMNTCLVIIFVTEYKKTTELENKLCQFIGCKYCIMTVNGTTAILLGLMSLDLDIGDEVIVPNYTMIATINAVKFLKTKTCYC